MALNTIVNQPTGVSLQLTDYFLTWQGSQSPSTRKVPVSNLGTYYAALAGATFTGGLTVSSGGIAVTGNSSITGTLSVSSTFTVAAGGIVVTTGGASLTATGGWSSFNIGKQLIVQRTDGNNNPGIAITDKFGTNLFGIFNNVGQLAVAAMPAYADSVTAPTHVQTWQSGSTSVTGTLTTSGAITVSAGGVAITGNSTLAGTLGGLTGLTVASGGLTVTSGGATITGSSSVTGALTVSTAGTSGNQVTNFSQFAQSLGTSGYIKLPGGLIMQWGIVTTDGSGNGGVTFPTAFLTACYSVIVMPRNATGTYCSTNGIPSTTSFTAFSSSPSTACFWQAVGV